MGQSAFTVSEGQVVAIDGKQVRRSHDKRAGKAAIYRVSAWAAGAHLTLGQRKVDNKSNEITAIPKLLEMLSLKGCETVKTLDSLHRLGTPGGFLAPPLVASPSLSRRGR